MDIPNCFYRVIIKGLILDDKNKFLLCKEHDGRWDLPGGGLDFGEDPIACLRREIQEEMGLTVTSIAEAPSYVISAEKTHRNFWILNIVYTMTVQHLDIVPTDECTEVSFFNVQEASELQLFANVEKFIKKFSPANH